MTRRALVVEDSPDMMNLLQTLMTGWGYEVDVVSNGRMAIEMTAAVDYSIVIMDLKLDGNPCGIEAARAIRSLAASRGSVPILALTGGMVTTTVAEMSAAGFAAMLQKPVLPDDLRCHVERYSKEPLT